MIQAIELATARKLVKRSLPWPVISLAGFVVPLMREISEMSYLWHRPHRLDGSELEIAIGKVPHTEFETAIADALRELGYVEKPQNEKNLVAA